MNQPLGFLFNLATVFTHTHTHRICHIELKRLEICADVRGDTSGRHNNLQIGAEEAAAQQPVTCSTVRSNWLHVGGVNVCGAAATSCLLIGKLELACRAPFFPTRLIGAFLLTWKEILDPDSTLMESGVAGRRFGSANENRATPPPTTPLQVEEREWSFACDYLYTWLTSWGRWGQILTTRP